jgi:hypothetical protein
MAEREARIREVAEPWPRLTIMRALRSSAGMDMGRDLKG